MTEWIENNFLRISVKARGAELASIFNKKNQQEYLWQGDINHWPRQAPVLFPVVGKLKENKYIAEGKAWSLSQHGFARDKDFQIIDKKNDSLTFSLQSSEETLRIYPYKFELIIKYLLVKNKLTTQYNIVNKDDKTIWFSIGAHPGFNCPLNGTENFSDYYIEFEKNETLERHLLTDGLFDGRKEVVLNNERILNLSEDIFLKDALVFKNLASSSLKLKSRKSDYEFTFEFKGFPFLGIWSKKEGAPFICIEPWFGIADKNNFEGELKDKAGILSLEKGKIFDCGFWIEIK
jgi:galactose mutarotase-like enzyme